MKVTLGASAGSELEVGVRNEPGDVVGRGDIEEDDGLRDVSDDVPRDGGDGREEEGRNTCVRISLTPTCPE